MHWLGLALSVAMLIGSGAAVARALGRSGIDRCWLFVAAAPVHIGLASIATSLVGRYQALPFLTVQAALLAAALLWTRRRSPAPAAPPDPLFPPSLTRDWMCLACLATALLLLGLSAATQALTPISGGDELMYHAPRIAHWMQNRSIFFYQTANDRQTVFPFGAELFAAWPLLFVKLELLARMFFWIAFPLAAAGVFAVCRTLGGSLRTSSAAAMLFVATPAVSFHAASLKSDAWLPLFMLGIVHHAVRPSHPDARPGRPFLAAGFFAALATNIKTTALPLLGVLAVLALFRGGVRGTGRRWSGLAAGFILAAASTGLGSLFLSNVVHYGNPLGPSYLSKLVQPQFGPRQTYTHAVRIPFVLAEMPEAMPDGLRAWIERRGIALCRLLDADHPLQWEAPTGWPGRFAYSLPTVAWTYSLGGMIWLPALLAGLAIGAREFQRTWPRPELGPIAITAALGAAALGAVVFGVRWMGSGPNRFWLGAYAISVPLAAAFAGRWSARSAWAAAAAGLGLVWAAYPALNREVRAVETAVIAPPTQESRDGVFNEITPRLEPGARILLVGSMNAREYGLFNPRGGYTNRVHPWGTAMFSPERLESVIRAHGITDVVIEYDKPIRFQGAGILDTREIVRWLQSSLEFLEAPLRAEHVRHFQRRPRMQAAE